MKTKIFVWIFLIFIKAMCASGQSESDLEKITWRSEDVAELAGSLEKKAENSYINLRVESSKVGRVYSIDGGSWESHRMIKRFPLKEAAGLLDQILFDAYLIQNEKKQIVAVQMERTDWSPSPLTFEKVRTYLEGKYMKPKSDVTLKNAEIGIERRSIDWETGNSIIELVQVAIPDQGLYRIGLTYRGKPMDIKVE